jgi:CRISPR-associated protein Csy1
MDKNLEQFYENKNLDISKDIEKFLKIIKNYVVFCTHNPKLTNPDIPNNYVIWNADIPIKKGYVYSSTINSKQRDVSINASYSKVVSFLYLELEDGMSVYDHLFNETELSKKEFSNLGISYEEIVEAVKSIKFGYSPITSDRRLKQVYFPVNDSDYHLLSIVPEVNSIYEVKHINNYLKYDSDIKEIKEKRKKNEYSDKEIYNLPDLISVQYGGSKPQNISYLNSKEGGSSYLLSCFPPNIEDRKYRYPKYNFIEENLGYKKIMPIINRLIKFIKINYNNKTLRDYRDSILLDLLDLAFLEIDKLRNTNIGWSDSESYKNLSNKQKILLDDKYKDIRITNKEYFEDFCEDYSSYIVLLIKRKSKNNEIILSDVQRSYIVKLFMDYGEK